jgi:hypothetical protein
MANKMIRGLGVTMALAVGALLGCGGAIAVETDEQAPVVEQQPLLACGPGYTCPTGNTCVKGTCRPECDWIVAEVAVGRVEAQAERDALAGTCASGYRCCPGYYYSEERITNPYCMPSTMACATFP